MVRGRWGVAGRWCEREGCGGMVLGTLLRTWVGVKGAAKFAEAVARGDVASAEVIEARRSECRACEARTVGLFPKEHGGDETDAPSSWCGPALVELLHEGVPIAERYCGCLIAGKTCVASEECPRGKW